MIFGIDKRQQVVRAVALVCPRCGVDRTGLVLQPAHSRRSSSGNLDSEPVVVCDDCGHTSDLGVLDVPTTAQLTALLRDATIAALVVGVRSSNTRGVECVRDAAETALRDAGFGEAADLLDHALDDLSTIEARGTLRRIGPELTPHGKQAFLHRVAAVVSAAEPIGAAQRDVLTLVGREIGMAEPHINGVVAVAAAA